MKTIKLNSSVAIVVYKGINLAKEDVVKGKRGDGSEILKNVKSKWHKKENQVDIKIGVHEYPSWVLDVGMVKTLIELEKVTVVGKAPKTPKKVAEPKEKAKAKPKATKTELPD